MPGKKRFHGRTLRVRLTAELDKWLALLASRRPGATISDVARDQLYMRFENRHKA
jgi:hypothetical protein